MTISGLSAFYPAVSPRGLPETAPAGQSAVVRSPQSVSVAASGDPLQQVLTAEERAFFLGGEHAAPVLYDAAGQAGHAMPLAGLRLDVRA